MSDPIAVAVDSRLDVKLSPFAGRLDKQTMRLDEVQKRLAEIEARLSTLSGTEGGDDQLRHRVARHAEHLARLQTVVQKLEALIQSVLKARGQ